MHNSLVLLAIILGSQSCRDQTNEAASRQQDTIASKEQTAPDPVPDAFKSASFGGDSGKMSTHSFVVSCGSGCAMTHNVRKITQLRPSAIEVTFGIELYTDETLTESYDETYTFYYTAAKTLERIAREGESGNALETFPPSAKRAFEDFGIQLVR